MPDDKQLIIAFKEVFGSAYGIKVLAHLEKYCWFKRKMSMNTDSSPMRFIEGRRDVYLEILDWLSKDPIEQKEPMIAKTEKDVE